MIAYESTVSYKLIYVFNTSYEDHMGLLKIGETKIKTALAESQLPPNCEQLNNAAIKRINQETKTFRANYTLLYTELAVRKIRLADGSVITTTFSDRNVNEVLSRSGYPSRKFYEGDKPSEWYSVSLRTAQNAIKAVKEGRNVLTEAEKIDASDTDTEDNKSKIELREEQIDAIKRTIAVYRNADRMLWDCKMRFGKTISACTLVKEEDFQKTIVVTHRPVVADGWQSDYHKVFDSSDDHIFLTKIKGGKEIDFDEHIDGENARSLRNASKSGKRFMYFASMQDLRESERVKPDGYKKNDAVFDMDWDFIIYDEAHEGTQTTLGEKVQYLLETPKNGKTPKILSLSGTSYNIIEKYDDNVYSWNYVMEQERKREWDIKYPGVPNPYADLPELRIYTFDLRNSMPNTYRYETVDMAFNFREFFRTWTGDPKKDYSPLPLGAKIGDFVHEEDVKAFLNLISSDDKESLYPFSTHEYRTMFKHTFWMVPGVKAAFALAELLRHHPVFMHYKVANVAGEGDEEKAYDDALKEVRSAINSNPYTITISCGRLTTGVTVPEWTAVMLLSGSSNTSAMGYMQTIFRVQSAGSIDGKQKTTCYAFDFAPDRAITVLSDIHSLQSRRKNESEGGRIELGEFLNYCPVLSVDGTGMHPYDVPKMMRQIKRLTVDKAIKSGFDDDSVYKSETGIVMDDNDVAVIQKLGSILSRTKQTKVPKAVKINNQGLTEEQHIVIEKAKNKPKRERTPEEEALLEKEKKQRRERDKVIQLLRNISIRLPLLIYGADVDLTESIHMEDFPSLVDDESWKEFMPDKITKDLFRQLLKFYDEDVIVGAGLRIRRMAKAADELPPTQRVMRIAEIFSMFRNPDKETVLTPWRVVNMHLSDMLGGYCFYDESFDQKDGILDSPRWVDREAVSSAVFEKSEPIILEMNSKSGLYPLYMAYSIYAKKLTKDEDTIPLEETQEIWKSVVDNNVYVLCKTQMARAITMRSLIGYNHWKANAIYLPKLIDRMQDAPRLSRKLSNPKTWKKEGNKMRFDAIVGNPPFNTSTGGGSDSLAASQSKPLYQFFVGQAKNLQPEYISMIIPARWYNGGIGLNDFRADMLSDKRIMKLVDYSNAKELFPTVDIAGGVCYFLWDNSYDGDCIVVNSLSGQKDEMKRCLQNDFSDGFIRSNTAISIINRIKKKTDLFVSDMVSALDTFGLPSHEKGHEEYTDGDILLLHSVGANGQGTDYIARKQIEKNVDQIDRFKIKISIMVPQNGEVGVDPEKGYRSISSPQILYPGTVDTFSYINIGFFDTEQEAINFRDFMTCKFPRFMMRITYSSVHISIKNFMFVPMMDFTQPWTDEKLYEYFDLSKDEIEIIEKTMRPLILEKDDVGKDFYEKYYQSSKS